MEIASLMLTDVCVVGSSRVEDRSAAMAGYDVGCGEQVRTFHHSPWLNVDTRELIIFVDHQ